MSTAKNLTVTLERLSRVLQNESFAGGLKPVQWEVLRYLALCNRFSRNPSAVTAFLGLTKGTVSQSLIALERKGLVSKQSSAADRRNIQLALTSKGQNLLDDDPLSTMLQGTQKLGSDNQELIAQGLQTLLHSILQKRGQKMFGQCKTCTFFDKDKRDGHHRCRLLDVPLSDADSQMICVEHQPAT